MSNFIFKSQTYVPQHGDNVDFAFSSDVVVSVKSKVDLILNTDVAQDYSISTFLKIDFKSTIIARQPLQLRFNTPWLNAVNPLRIRFVDTPIVRDNSFGIECGFSWFTLDAVEQALMLAEFSSDIESKIESPWENYNADEVVIETPWSSNITNDSTLSMVWLFNPDIRTDTSVNWSLPIDHQITLKVNWVVPDEHQIQPSINWLDIAAHQLHTAVAWIDGQDQESPLIIQYRGIVVDDEKSIKWGFHEPRWVCSTKYRPPVGKVTLRFNEPLSTQPNPIVLRFTASPNYCYWDDGGGLIDGNPTLPNIDFKIPIEPQIRRYYLMQPTISCVRVIDAQVIVITSVSISDARGQFTQGVSIEFGSAIDASRAHNQLLLITINGYEFFAIAEQVNKSSSFGTASFSANGRSKTALLAAPWKTAVSYTNSVAKSFGGLLSDILMNSGWTVELVDISDFIVPAGAYSAIADSPLDLLNDAVSQLNCMMIADEVNQMIKVYPRWPTVPWSFASAIADVNIHDAVILTYSAQEEINQACDVVWLRGEQKGISASVKRQGSAGTTPAADISASLIVDVQAARVAGTMALADTGNKEMINITLPIMNDLPPLRKGMLIGVTYQGEVYKAICDQVSISATVDPNGGIDIYQSVKLIRHI